MPADWFYEYDGRRTGPVPSETLRHLAYHGAISPETNVWKGGMDTPVPASQVKNLFRDVVEASVVRESHANETVTQYLQEALDACRDEDEDRLKAHAPPIAAIHPFSISGILLDYEIVEIRRVPTPVFDSSLPPERQTKPVRQMYEATVRVTLCQRPNYRASLEEIRQLQPGRHEETVIYQCKEFNDGEWLFLDASIAG